MRRVSGGRTVAPRAASSPASSSSSSTYIGADDIVNASSWRVRTSIDGVAERTLFHMQSLWRTCSCAECGVVPRFLQQLAGISADDGIDARNTAGSEPDYGDR